MGGLFYEHTMPQVKEDSDGFPIRYSCDELMDGNIPPTSMDIDYYYDMMFPTDISPEVAIQFVEAGLIQEIARRYRLTPTDGSACTMAPKSSSNDEFDNEYERDYNTYSSSSESLGTAAAATAAEEAAIISENIEEENDYWMVDVTSKPDDVINTLFDDEGTCQVLTADNTNSQTTSTGRSSSNNSIFNTNSNEMSCKTIAGKLTIGVYGVPNTDGQIKQFIASHLERSTKGTEIQVQLIGFEINQEVYENRDEITTTSAINNNDGTLQTAQSAKNDKVTPEGYIFAIGLAVTALLFIFIIVRRIKRRHSSNNNNVSNIGGLEQDDSIDISHDDIEIDGDHGQPAVHAIPKQSSKRQRQQRQQQRQVEDDDDVEDESTFDPYGSSMGKLCTLGGVLAINNSNDDYNDDSFQNSFDENEEDEIPSPLSNSSLGRQQRSQLFGLHGNIDDEYDDNNDVDIVLPPPDDKYATRPSSPPTLGVEGGDDRYSTPSPLSLFNWSGRGNNTTGSRRGLYASTVGGSTSPANLSNFDSDAEDSWAQTDASLGSIELSLQPLEAEV